MALAATIIRISPNVFLETVDNVVVLLNIITLPSILCASIDAALSMRHILEDNTFDLRILEDQSSA
jgi:hypothetical protein